MHTYPLLSLEALCWAKWRQPLMSAGGWLRRKCLARSNSFSLPFVCFGCVAVQSCFRFVLPVTFSYKTNDRVGISID